jgi:Phage capsid protein
MSVNVNTAFVQQYSTNIMMLLQQQGSRLRNAVQNYSFVGKAASMAEQFGQVSPVRNQSRHSDTPLISTPQDKRWIYPNDYDWADLIDQQDRLRMLIDPSGPYTMAGVYAMGRAIDDEIIAGIFGSNNTGENGTSATGTLYAYNSNSQSVAAATGAASATGLNIAKLRAAKRKLLEADLDIDNDQLFAVISAKQHDDLLNEAQAVSLDYNTRPVLVDGKITQFMGFNFIHSERIPGAANFNSAINTGITSADSDGSYVAGSRWMVPVFAKSGMALGMWNDIQASVDRRPDKRNSWQVYVTGTFGGARLEEKRCVLINCK